MSEPTYCEWCPNPGRCDGPALPRFCRHMRPEGTPAPPGLIARAASLTRAVVAHAADGFREPTPEQVADRERTCRACPHLDQAADRCNLCGCSLMNAKRAMRSSECPDHRWPAI